MLLPLMFAAAAACTSGCGSGIRNPSSAFSTLSLTPATVSVSVGQTVSMLVGNDSNTASCVWSSSSPEIASIESAGVIAANSTGVATVRVDCPDASGSAAVAVTPAAPGPITITKGGTYSGTWVSPDPNTPAVLITTTDPVTITNSVVSGRGTLIRTYGGALTVTNTTGIGTDPMVSGVGRGKFINAEKMTSVTVRNCTTSGTSFGVYIAGSNLAHLDIENNIGSNLDDRNSDGVGGTLLNSRVLGHFIMLNQDVLSNGGVIAWNQFINDPGVGSIEDVISVYQSHAASNAAPVQIHDNYIEGAAATGQTSPYTGTGIQFDGGTNDPAQADGFVKVTKNIVVRTANTGISIGAGHDINIQHNRVVSCGQDGLGNWNNHWGQAFVLLNYYKTAQFFNNTVSMNTGGLVVTLSNQQQKADLYAPSVSTALANVAADNGFDDPCWVNGTVTQAAEATERAAWFDRLAQAARTVGDAH